VVQYGKDGATEFNRHTFAYYDEARKQDGSYKGFAPSTLWNSQDDSVSTVSMFGNGSVSALGGSVGKSLGGSFYFGVGTCCDVASKEISQGVRIGYSNSQNETLLVMADVNGDGLPDKVFQDKNDKFYYYRPNCSGAGSFVPAGCNSGIGDYFGIKTKIGIPSLGHDSTTTTSAGANIYISTAVMAETSDSYTTSDTYVTDVNGDGIPDIVTGGQVIFGLVSNGVPAYSPNSADTPVPIGAGTVDTSNLLADPSAIEAQRAANFPLLDTVRRWVAPYDGTISINAPVQLIQDTSTVRAQYQTADGVRVAIQLGSSELWSARIQATDYTVKTPSGVSGITVKKGDALYFRVQSVNDGSYDQVNWDPEITYQGVDASRQDANNLPVYDYRASIDYTLAGRTATVRAPLTGTVHLAGTLVKGITSDDIRFVVYQNGTAVYTLPLTGAQAANQTISQDIQVAQLDQLQWKIETDSPIDASQVQFQPQAWYTAAQGVAGVQDEHGNYVLQLNPTWTMDLYPANQLTAPQSGYIVKRSDLNADGTITVAASIGSKTLGIGAALPVAFTIKRTGLLLAKNILTLSGTDQTNGNPPPSATTTLKVAAQSGDILYFDFSSRNTTALTLLDTYSVQVGNTLGSNPPPPAPSALRAAAAEGLFAQPYRNWSVFGYNGNSPRDAQAIDQSLLVLDNVTDASKVYAYPYAPDPATSHWTGPDSAAWVYGGQSSSTRIGIRNVAMPRGAQFAGASAPPRMSHSHNDSADSAKLGVGGSIGTSESQVEYEDLNGDRFPDVISQGGVQYTAMSGGLSGTAGGGIGSARTSTTTSANASLDASSKSVTVANMRGDDNPSGERSASTAKSGPIEPPLGLGGSIGGGKSDTQSDLIDINGDGLPDKVFHDGTVWLNTGYEFVPDGNWGGGVLNSGQTINAGVNYGFSMDNGSIAGGLNLEIGDSYTNETYADINGDGLPDKITQPAGILMVSLNTGSGFAPAIAWPSGQDSIAQDKNLTLGAGAAYTAGIPFVIAGIKIVFTPSFNTGITLGRPELAFRDMDGDGYPDQAYSIKDDSLYVALNQIGRTNLLKEVQRPLGATIDLEYTRTGNTYAMPQSRWVMSKVQVDDGFHGDGVDVQKTAYAYSGGNYDRYERDFYGFKSVTEQQLDADDTAYRSVTTTYLNRNYYDKGLAADELTSAGNNGAKYLETLNTYTLRDINAPAGAPDWQPGDLDGNSTTFATQTLFPMLVKTERHFYEGGQGDKSTYTTQEYDALGNVTHFADSGDTGSADDVEALINYSTGCTDSYIVGRATDITVVGNGQLMRSRRGAIDCATGNLTRLSQFLDDGSAAVTGLAYFPNGNLQTLTGPANAKGQRYTLNYAYDNAVSTYVTGISDSFGYSSGAAYDYNFGKPLTTTDLNGNVISYVYDPYGRTTAVKGPYEQPGSGTSSGNTTLQFTYFKDAVVPYATTQHLNLDAKGAVQSPIETVLFIDGIKRVLQTKKSATVDGKTVLIDSGRVLFDALGRTVKQYYPMSEPLGSDGVFNTAFDSVTPTVTDYDVLDRTVQTILPDTTTTKMEYGIGSDGSGTRFTTLVTDANGKQKESYRDVRELITSVKEYNKGAAITTRYAYDPLKQITQVVDAKGNTTQVAYDNLGRRTSIANPDTGKTETVYDLASNPVQKITAVLRLQGKAVSYDYDYNRLAAIHYPLNPGNDVSYTYGDSTLHNNFNQIGRIVKVSDAAGSDQRQYGKLGEMTLDTRTIASHTQGNSANSPEVYTTQYKYDTFGRLMTLTLPDTEVVTHGYDAGGNLDHIEGSYQGTVTPYLQTLQYDKFEQRVYLKLGNGVETRYSYNPANRRLSNLQSQDNVAGQFQNLNYGYDKVGNIMSLANDTAVPPPNSFGGPTAQTFGYDDLYRLTSAKGSFQSSPDKTRNYTLAMGYDNIHNIVAKTQADALTNAGGTAVTQKATSYDWAYAYSGVQPHAPTHIGERTFYYDADGNQTGWTNDRNGTRRDIAWDEDNRIRSIADNGDTSRYVYDDAGQRVIKVSKQGETAYINQYYVVRNRSIVSKHIFAGASRIATELDLGSSVNGRSRGQGGGSSTGSGQGGSGGGNANGNAGGNSNNGNAYAYGQDKAHGQSGQEHGNSSTSSGQAGNSNAGDNGNGNSANAGNGNANNDHGNAQGHGNGNSSSSLARKAGEGGAPTGVPLAGGEGADATNLPGNSEAGLENALANGKGNKYGIYKRLDKLGDSVDASGEIVASGSGVSGTGTANGQSSFLYYYHPDHLGSTGYVTDAAGRLYEHMEYFPFGETWVQEHSNTLRTPYLFTGKEFDQETGLYYFGARYYDPRTSVWVSADPILGKYLPSANPNNLAGMGGVYRPRNMSLYKYASNNPLIVTDPDGNEDLVTVPSSSPQVTARFESKALMYKDNTVNSLNVGILKIVGAVKSAFGGKLNEKDVESVLGKPTKEYSNFSSLSDDPKTKGTAASGEIYDYKRGRTSKGLTGLKLSSSKGEGNVPQDPSFNGGTNPHHPNRNAGVVEGAFIHPAGAGDPKAAGYTGLSDGCIIGKQTTLFQDLHASKTGDQGHAVIFR
jgi:RHS repeat-associated protein